MSDEEYTETVKKYIELDQLRSNLIGEIGMLQEDRDDLEERLKKILAIGIDAQKLSLEMSCIKIEIPWIDSELMDIGRKLRKAIEKYTSGDFKNALEKLEDEAEKEGWEYISVPIPEWGEDVYTKKWFKMSDDEHSGK
jgi:hypothetical protein